ncbi:MAG: flagellar hook-associated protein FlgK [Bacillota bacterium]
MTIFGSFEIGRKALRAQHKGMEVSGQNVANANTPGYTRQRTDMESVVAPMVKNPSMAPGRGVDVADVVRVRSEFYHNQLLSTNSNKEYWDNRYETFLGAEAIFMEPEEHGINKYLNDFFDSWQELSSSPEEASVRAGLRENAISLTRTVQDVFHRLNDQIENLEDELSMIVNDVNRISDTIAELNEKIRFIDTMQEKSNELFDQLDLAIEELSELVDININRQANGTVEIFSGGRLLVQEDRSFHVSVGDGGDEGKQIVSSRGLPLQLSSGKVQGLLDAINVDLPALQGELNELIEVLVKDVNEIHRQGFAYDSDQTDIDFFKPLENEDVPAAIAFEVSEAVIEDGSNIAAANVDFAPGNGDNALEISSLRDEASPDRLGGVSIADYYQAMVTSMGVEAQDSERMVGAFEKTLGQLQEMHESISGVNLDEEMLNMVQYQHSWHAAARYLNYVDQMLGVLFTELGR